MNQAIIASVPMAPMQMPVVRRRRVKVTEPEIKLPPRGSRGPVTDCLQSSSTSEHHKKIIQY